MGSFKSRFIIIIYLFCILTVISVMIKVIYIVF